MNTKKKHIKTFLFAVMISFSVAAQNNVTVTDTEFTHSGGMAQVEFQIDLNRSNVKKRSFVLLVPVLENGDLKKEFAPVLVNGKVRHKALRRMEALGRGPTGISETINAGDKNAPTTHFYSATTPLEPWMVNATFSVRFEHCDCSGPMATLKPSQKHEKEKEKEEEDKQLDLSGIRFMTSFKEPPLEEVKARSETGTANLDFATGSATLNPNFRNNATELAKIGEMIERVKVNPAINITKITLDGYASPEGNANQNMALSVSRVNSLKEHLSSRYSVDQSIIHATGHGEDWRGLERLLIDREQLAYRREALLIIRSERTNVERRKTRLMRLQGGAPYRDMLANLYPILRRVDYELHFNVSAFSVDEGKRVLETDPSLLSLDEMFTIARTYPRNSPERRRVFNIAAETFPSSDIANFNAASLALEAADMEAAQEYLFKVANRDAAWENNLGMLHVLKEEYDIALEQFQKAANQGNAEARQNIAEIDKLLTD